MDHGVIFLNQERLADDERKPRGHDDAVEMQVRRQTGVWDASSESTGEARTCSRDMLPSFDR